MQNLKTYYPALLLVILLCVACNKKETIVPQTSPDEWLIIGDNYGNCAGDCAHLFKLTDGKIYADDGIEYLTDVFNTNISFKSIALENEVYEIAKHLKEEFPNSLLKEDENYFGMPDAHDQGGIFIALHQDGLTNRWYFDTVEKRVPVFMQDYVKDIKEVLSEIRE